MKRSVTVTVAGQKLAIKTAAKQSYVRQLAAMVNARIDDIKASGGRGTTQSLALLAAMNIADELLQLQNSQDELKRKVREKSKRILKQLDAHLKS